MMTIGEKKMVRAIARRAADIYERYGRPVNPQFIESELMVVHDEICTLRLSEMCDADDGNLMHDIAGIHRHVNFAMNRFEDCFWPRFASQQ